MPRHNYTTKQARRTQHAELPVLSTGIDRVQIIALCNEASVAGDFELVNICRTALDPETSAVELWAAADACARAISNARLLAADDASLILA